MKCACVDFDPAVCAEKRGVAEVDLWTDDAYSCQCPCHDDYWQWEYWKKIDEQD